MTTIFDHINDILIYKKGDLLDNVDCESGFNPYIINRWLSMYSPDLATIINSTTNWLYPIFDTKTEQYQFLLQVVPSSPRKRINYIKKPKVTADDGKRDKVVTLLSHNLEISKREVNYYIDTGKLDIANYLESL